MRLCQYQNFLLCKGSKKFVTNNAKLLTVIQSSILHSWWIFKGCQISLRKITLKLFKKVKLATYLANKPPSGSSEGSYLFRVQSTLLLSHFRQKFLDTYMPSEIRLLKMFLGIRQFLTLHSRKCCYCLSLAQGCVIFSAFRLSLVEITQSVIRLSHYKHFLLCIMAQYRVQFLEESSPLNMKTHNAYI